MLKIWWTLHNLLISCVCGKFYICFYCRQLTATHCINHIIISLIWVCYTIIPIFFNTFSILIKFWYKWKQRAVGIQVNKLTRLIIGHHSINWNSISRIITYFNCTWVYKPPPPVFFNAVIKKRNIHRHNCVILIKVHFRLFAIDVIILNVQVHFYKIAPSVPTIIHHRIVHITTFFFCFIIHFVYVHKFFFP